MITLEQLKNYLGIDGEEQNILLTSFLRSAKHIVEKVLRKDLGSMGGCPEIINTAVQFICWQMYFHRDSSEFNMREIEKTVAVMLADLRECSF